MQALRLDSNEKTGWTSGHENVFLGQKLIDSKRREKITETKIENTIDAEKPFGPGGIKSKWESAIPINNSK